jgi:hypothetical protein
MLIQVKAMITCGQVRFYPVNDAANHLAKLTKSTTFTITMLRHAKAMGARLECMNMNELRQLRAYTTDLTLFGE